MLPETRQSGSVLSNHPTTKTATTAYDSSLPVTNMPSNSPKTYRVHGLPIGIDKTQAQNLLEALLSNEEGVQVRVRSLAPDLGHLEMVATIEIDPLPLALQDPDLDRWEYTLKDDQGPKGTNTDIELTLDTHFRGLTPISMPTSTSNEPRVSIIAVSGLGGHAFGSFKDRGSSFMWLRDWLPRDANFTNVYLHGYDSRLSKSNSFQSIRDLGTTVRSSIQHVLGRQQAMDTTHPNSQPAAEFVVLLGHSLGGIIIKEALLQIAEGPIHDRALLQRIYGLVFFGVPNRGMRIESLRAMAGNGPNRSLLETLGPESEVLRHQALWFPRRFNDHDSEVLCFYETEMSPTAKETDGKFSMTGDPEIMVGSDSATHVRPWEEEEKVILRIDRTHSEMVKFPRHDYNGRMVVQSITAMCRRASQRSQRGILNHGSDNLPNTRRNRNNPFGMLPTLPSQIPTTNASPVPPSNLRNPNDHGSDIPALDANMQIAINRQMFQAIGTGNLSRVRDLVQSGADVNSSDGPMFTPTALAFAAKCYEMVKGPRSHVLPWFQSYQQTQMKNHADIIRYLKSSGANWDRETPDTKVHIRDALQYGNIEFCR